MKIVEGEANIEDTDSFISWLETIGNQNNCAIQAFDATMIAGRKHIRQAVTKANRSFQRDENVARERNIEILLYAAGRRQINDALELGIQEGNLSLIVVIDGDNETQAKQAIAARLTDRDTIPLRDERKIRDYFDISARELNATKGSLEDLVCERVALLDVEK
ncbi:MAG: KEOPS complex subunit Cgi121 [Halobacteriaceae archaeon]